MNLRLVNTLQRDAGTTRVATSTPPRMVTSLRDNHYPALVCDGGLTLVSWITLHPLKTSGPSLQHRRPTARSGMSQGRCFVVRWQSGRDGVSQGGITLRCLTFPCSILQNRLEYTTLTGATAGAGQHSSLRWRRICNQPPAPCFSWQT